MPDFDAYLTWLGVPLSQRPPTYYQLLGVDPSITDPEVVKTLAIQRIAYVRNFQRGEHGEVCARILEELVQAEVVLTNPARRAEYDRSLRPVEPPKPSPPPPVRAVPAKAVAVPAAVVPESSSVKRPKRGRNRRQQAEAIKWAAIGASVLIVVVTGGIIANGLRRPSSESVEKKDIAAAAKPERKPEPAPKPAAPIVVRYRPEPSDATAEVATRNATLKREPPDFMVNVEPSSMAAGVEVSFSKKGFASKTVRVQPGDAGRGIIDVRLEPLPRRTSLLTVIPEWVEVAAADGEATRGDKGRWAVSATTATPRVTVSASGFVTQVVELNDGSRPTTVELKGDASQWWKHYRGLGADSVLRLVGRAGGFGSGARQIALSRNGKFLAVAEGSFPIRIHVWDVENERFVGRVMSLKDEGATDDFTDERVPAWSIAVTGDGKTVAMSALSLLVFDVAEGGLAKRFGKLNIDQIGIDEPKTPETRRSAAADPVSSATTDVLSVSFSADDSKLFAVLRSGKVVVRDAANWSIIETLSGFEPGSEDVRIDDVGDFALANARSGAKLWERSTGKTKLLNSTKAPLEPGRWSGRPEDGHFVYAPQVIHQPDRGGRPQSARDPLNDKYPIFVRAFDAPLKDRRRIEEVFPVQYVESVSADYVAALVYRWYGPTSGDGDYGLRIWSSKDGRFIGDAFAPHVLHSVRASADGRVIATVADRERAVYLWKFNPDGKRSFHYSDAVGWSGHPRMRWNRLTARGRQWKPTPGSDWLTIEELGDGKWRIVDKKDGGGELTEKLRSNYAIVLEGGGDRYHLFNRGSFWTFKPGKRRDPNELGRLHYPNFEGYLRRSYSFIRNDWWEETSKQGYWTSGDLKPRLDGAEPGP